MSGDGMPWLQISWAWVMYSQLLLYKQKTQTRSATKL